MTRITINVSGCSVTTLSDILTAILESLPTEVVFPGDNLTVDLSRSIVNEVKLDR